MSATYNTNMCIIFSLLLSIAISKSDPSNDSKGWSTPAIYAMIIANLFSIIPIILSLIHFTYSLIAMESRSRFPINKLLIFLQIVISLFGITSSFTYGFFRSNVIINDIHTERSCYIIYCVSLLSWAIGRMFCLLSFIFRIHLSFKGSVLSYSPWILSFFAGILVFAAITVMTALVMVAEPEIMTATDNASYTVCMSQTSESASDGIKLIIIIFNGIDFILVTTFLFMFVYKLHKLKVMNKTFDNMSDNSYDNAGGYKFRSYSDSVTNDKKKNKETAIVHIQPTLPGKQSSNATNTPPPITPIPNISNIKVELSNLDIIPPNTCTPPTTHINDTISSFNVSPDVDTRKKSIAGIRINQANIVTVTPDGSPNIGPTEPTNMSSDTSPQPVLKLDVISSAMAATENNVNITMSNRRTRSVHATEIVDHQQILNNIQQEIEEKKECESESSDDQKNKKNKNKKNKNKKNKKNNKKKKVHFVQNTMKSPKDRHKEMMQRKRRHRPRELDDLERLMCKQTILVFIIIISSWIFNGSGLFDIRFTLCLGVDAMVNTLCSWLVFKYTNKYWNGCIEGLRCYCCYDLCWNYFGCYLCNSQNGCRDCKICCDSTIQRMGTSLRSLSLRDITSNSNTESNIQNSTISPSVQSASIN